MVGIILQEEIDESGTGHFYFGDRFACRQGGEQRFGDFAGILARGLSQAHRKIAGEVAVLRIAGIFNFDADPTCVAGNKVFR
jgi:hypothetical protein